jgi:hypothetical protein
LVLGVSNLPIGVVKGHNSSGGKLPLSPVFQGNFPTKDVVDASIKFLVGMTRVLIAFLFGLVLLIRPLVVLAIIFVAIFVAAALPFAGVQVVDRLQTLAIPHCMVGIWMNQTGTLKDLGIGILIVALGRWLDSVDGIVTWSVVALPPPKVILPTPITIVIAAVTVIIVPIIATVVTTPIIWAAILLVGARSLADIFLDLLVGLISICPLLHHREVLK